MAEFTDTQNLYPTSGEVLEEKYEIQEVLGVGAMGSVVRAYHLLRKAPVALKFMSPEILGQNDVVERFLNEGVAASKIDSEHVVKVYDVSKLPSGVPYMVMEFLQGEDLSHLLAREGTPFLPDVTRAIHLTLQILRGLQVAHRAKIIHRDMKPANCFVTGKEDDRDFIKIVDFGISKLRRDDEDEGVALTHAGAALGTPLYMSLEQARSPRDVDARTDLYSTAVILYELLAGVPPFVPESGTLSELFTMLALEAPKPISGLRGDLPDGLWEVIKQGLDKNPDKRFQSAGSMAEALVPFSDERSDYVVSKMLRATATGGLRSRVPPPMATTSGPASTAGSGTVMMGPAESGRIAPTLDEAPPGMLKAGAHTAQGTVRDAPTIIERKQSTPVSFAIAIVAVGAVAVAAWLLGRGTGDDDSTTDTTNAVIPEVVVSSPSTSPSPVTPAPPPAPTASLSASTNPVVPPPPPSTRIVAPPTGTKTTSPWKSAKDIEGD